MDPMEDFEVLQRVQKLSQCFVILVTQNPKHTQMDPMEDFQVLQRGRKLLQSRRSVLLFWLHKTQNILKWTPWKTFKSYKGFESCRSVLFIWLHKTHNMNPVWDSNGPHGRLSSLTKGSKVVAAFCFFGCTKPIT